MTHRQPHFNYQVPLPEGHPGPGVVLGNGESRRSHNLYELVEKALIVGCNAIFRDFYPDYLCSVDDKMQTEIKASAYPSERHLHQLVKGKASGPSAVAVAAYFECTTIYLVGFDMMVTHRCNDKGHPLTNNIYRDTRNYHPSATLMSSPVSWILDIVSVVLAFPKSRYVQVGPPFSLKPPFPDWYCKPQVDKRTAQVFTDRFEFLTWEQMLKELA